MDAQRAGNGALRHYRLTFALMAQRPDRVDRVAGGGRHILW